MYTSIPLHGLKRSCHSRSRRVNADNKNTLSMHIPRRRNVTTFMVGLENGHMHKNLTKNGEAQRYCWEHRRRRSVDSHYSYNGFYSLKHRHGHLKTTAAAVCLFVGCLASQQHASVSQGRICSDNFTCCHTETEVADQTFYLTQSQYTDTGPTSPSADPITPGVWQGSHWSANFLSHWYDSTQKNPGASGIRTLDLPLPRRTPKPLGHRGGRRRRLHQATSDDSGKDNKSRHLDPECYLSSGGAAPPPTASSS